MFSIHAGYYGNEPVVTISSKQKGVSATISRRGANLLTFIRPEGNYIDGYRNEEELKKGTGARSCIMLPYSNRIAGNRYTFLGSEYQLAATGPFGINIHGYLHAQLLTLSTVSLSEREAMLVFSGAWQKGHIAGYPWELQFSVYFRIRENGVELRVTVYNPNAEPLPVCTGWHPYFVIPGSSLGDCTLEIPAKHYIVTDDNYLPLPGSAAHGVVAGTAGVDFTPEQPEVLRRLNNHRVNCCYTGLATGNNGMALSSLLHQESGTALDVYQERGVLYAYTADDSPVRPRSSIALEPVEMITNAFNRQELSEDILLEPRHERSFTCGFAIRSF